MSQLRILLIEDEPAIADTLLYALRTEGFEPEWEATGEGGLAAVTADEPALVILDVGLPDANGFELCKIIRARSAVPVLFLTARNTEVDRVVGLEIGADDYVTKPFSPREVAVRVKAILRRVAASRPPMPGAGAPSNGGATGGGVSMPPLTAAAAAATLPPSGPPAGGAVPPAATGGAPPAATGAGGGGGDFLHDAERCEIRFQGTLLPLTRMEYRLLCTLLGRPGRVFSRDELLAQAWDDPGASLDRTVDAHVKTLRAKLHAVAPQIDPIQTHRGLGYSLRAGA